MKEYTLGDHGSVFHGTGVDFVGLRDWQAGDRHVVDRLAAVDAHEFQSAGHPRIRAARHRADRRRRGPVAIDAMRDGGHAYRGRHRARDGHNRAVSGLLSGYVRPHHLRQRVRQHGGDPAPGGPRSRDSLPRRVSGARGHGRSEVGAARGDDDRRAPAANDAAADDFGFSLRGRIRASARACRAELGPRRRSRDDRQRVRVRAAGRVVGLGERVRRRNGRGTADVEEGDAKPRDTRAGMAGRRSSVKRTSAGWTFCGSASIRRKACRRCSSSSWYGGFAKHEDPATGDQGLGIRDEFSLCCCWSRVLCASNSTNSGERSARQTPLNALKSRSLRSSAGGRPIAARCASGEQFMLTLTCAVLDTERVRVAVDESGLAPTALHLVPFEIVDGRRFRDILNAPRRFFQYQYTMRLLGEEFFGKEVLLPRLQISYRVQNSLQGGAALAGRETQYSLVPVPIRVLSLVPAGASDIRDTPPDTFGDVEARLFRSNLLLILAGVAFVLAALMAALIVARAAVKRRASVATTAPRHFAGCSSSRGRARARRRARGQPARRVEQRSRGPCGGGASTGGGCRLIASRRSEGGRSRHAADRRPGSRGPEPSKFDGQEDDAVGGRDAGRGHERKSRAPSPVWDSLSQTLGVFSARTLQPQRGS